MYDNGDNRTSLSSTVERKFSLEFVRGGSKETCCKYKIAQCYDYYYYYYYSHHNKHKLRAVISHAQQHIINLFLSYSDRFLLYFILFRHLHAAVSAVPVVTTQRIYIIWFLPSHLNLKILLRFLFLIIPTNSHSSSLHEAWKRDL